MSSGSTGGVEGSIREAVDTIRRAPDDRARVPRQPRRRRPRLDARALPRAPGRRTRRAGVVPDPVRRGAALSGAAGPRPAHPAPRVPRRARRHDHVRLRLARTSRRPRARGQGGARELVVIDHHISNDHYGTINAIDPEAAASGSLVHRIVRELGLPLNRDAAVCLYAALVCDTGRFQYETTTPAVFGMARRARPARRARLAPEPHAVRGAPLRLPEAARRRPRPRGARAAAAVRVDRGHAGRPAPARRADRGGRGADRHPPPHHGGRGDVRRQGGVRRHGPGEPPVARRRRRAQDRRGRRRRRSSLRRRVQLDRRHRRRRGPHRGRACPRPRDRPRRSSSSTSRRAGRRTTSSPACARSTGSGASATPARSIPTPPACCSSGSAGRLACCASSRRRGRRTGATIAFGVSTTTLDAAGEVLDRAPMPIDARPTSRPRPRAFLGEIEQVPPMVSAVKVKGRRLHELARKGIEVERAPRRVRIDRFDVEEFEPGPYPAATVLVECGSGTYIRSLAADLGERLGGVAHLASLRRLRVGSFDLSEAHTIEAIERDPETVVLEPVEAMRDLERVDVDAEQARAIAHGVTFPATVLAGEDAGPGPFALVGPDGELLAVYERRRSGAQADRRARAGRGDLTPWSSCTTPTRPHAAVTPYRWRGRHDRRVRRRAPRPPGGAPARPRARRRPWPVGGVRHLRPPSRPRSCGPSRRRSCSPRSSRSSSCSTPPATLDVCWRAARSTRSAATSRRRTSCARCSSTASSARLVVVGADFHFGHKRGGNVALLERMGAELGFEVLGLGLVADRRRPERHAVLVDPHPRAARRGRRRGGGRACSAGPHEVRGVVERATGGAASSASPPPTSPSRPGSASPPTASTPARSSTHDGVERPAAISLGRRPTFYEARTDVAARGPRARLRRRPLRPGGQGPLPRAPPRRGALRRGRRRWSSRCDRDVADDPPHRAESGLDPAGPATRSGTLSACVGGCRRLRRRQGPTLPACPIPLPRSPSTASTRPTPVHRRSRSRSSPSASTTSRST